MGNASSLHATYEMKSNNEKIYSLAMSSGSSHGESTISSCCVFWISRCECPFVFLFHWVSLFIWGDWFHPRAPATGQLPRRTWKKNIERAAWPWNIYGSLVFRLYEFWQWWHITLTFPQTMCCSLFGLGEARQSAWFHRAPILQSSLFSLSENKRYLSVL